MKSILFILIIGLLGIISPSTHPNHLIGKWKLSIVVQNGDTLYNHSDTSASIRYSFKSYSHLDIVDSNEVIQRAIKGFNNSARFSIIFNPDSTLLSSRIDRDTGFSVTSYDTGSYSLSGDTIIITYENSLKMNAFLIDRKKGVLYQDLGSKHYSIYNELIKIN